MKKITYFLLFTLSFFVAQETISAQACSGAPMQCGSTILGSNIGVSSGFNNASYACYTGSNSYSAGDVMYSFTVSPGTDISINMAGLRANLDLFLFEGNCSPSSCIDRSTRTGLSAESVSKSGASGRYYVVVDGATAGEENFFRIILSCSDDGGGDDDDDDDDDDGDDDDDDGSSFACNILPTLQCGSTYNLTTIGRSNQLDHSDYNACMFGLSSFSSPYTGNERVFRIVVPTGQDLNINMTGLNKDLDLFLFQSCVGNSLSGCAGRSIQSGNNNEQITLSASNANALGVYYLVVDGYNPAQQSNFTLKVNCTAPCEPQIDNNCDLISFFYAGTAFYNIYNLNVPNSVPSGGTWTARNSNGQTYTIGSGRAIGHNFSYAGVYQVCYTYQDVAGCDVSCCKTIYIASDPYECNAIAKDYNPYTNQWALSIPGVASHHVAYWRDDATGEVLSTNTNTLVINDPVVGECRYLSVYFYNPSTGYHQICCLTLCGGDACIGTPQSISCPSTDDPVCGCDGIQYLNGCYARKAGVLAWNDNPCPPRTNENCDDVSLSFLSALRYSFDVPGSFPSGSWIVTGGGYGGQVQTVGAGTSTVVNFPAAGDYTVCYNYLDEGINTQCCKNVSVIADPYECRQLQRTINGTNTTIFIPGIAAENVVQWRNDATGQELATETDRITVPIPALDECAYYSVLFYDAGCNCTRVCCIAICTTEEVISDECAVVQNASLNCKADGSYDYTFNLKNQSGRTNLTADITILSSIGPTFANCSNVATITGINDEVAINLNLEECIVPIQAGMEVAYKIVLNDAQGGWFCNLDPVTITLPNCDATPATCEAACVGTDLVKNGAFEGGYWAFTSELDDKCACDAGTYCIATDMAAKCPDNASMTADGKFLIVDARGNLPATIWAQDGIQVKAGNKYSFSFDFYAGNADNASPTLELWVGDNLLNADVTGTGGTWITINSDWTADVDATLRLSIRQSQSGGAATFAMDNIRFTYCQAATGNPLEDMAWIQAYVGNDAYAINQCVWNNEILYRIVTPCLAADVPIKYYDCNGNEYCTLARVGNTCPDDFDPSDCVSLQACNAPNLQNTGTANQTQTMALENYPNPFRNSTTIQFNLPTEMQASLSVFDTNGRLVYTTTANFSMGANQVELNASHGLSAGVYYYRLATATESITKSMLMMQ